MTVKEKLFELNKQFQISYYDTSFYFFSFDAPDMITQIKNFFSSTINDEHPLRLSINKHLKLLDKQLEDLKELAKTKLLTNGKKKWLNGFKINVSNACWGFRHDCWNYDENILNQEV